MEYIRRFEADYGPKPEYLVHNYRSTGHIIAAANTVIEPARHRMKVDNPVRIDRAREKDPPGGDWSMLDPVSRGQVQVLSVGDTPATQAQAVVGEPEAVVRLLMLVGTGPLAQSSLREWDYLDPVRTLCDMEGIPVQMANEDFSGLWHLRETHALVRWVRARESRVVRSSDLRAWLDGQPLNSWNELLRQGIGEYEEETGGAETPAEHFVEWLAEWGKEVRRRQRGLMLMTAHRAKGLEFDHVVVLDGGWDRVGRGEDRDAPRRLYYVAMTRARKTLAVADMMRGRNRMQDALLKSPSVLKRDGAVASASPVKELSLRYRRLGLGDVFLGFAGYRGPDHPIHDAVAALTPGGRT